MVSGGLSPGEKVEALLPCAYSSGPMDTVVPCGMGPEWGGDSSSQWPLEAGQINASLKVNRLS